MKCRVVPSGCHGPDHEEVNMMHSLKKRVMAMVTCPNANLCINDIEGCVRNINCHLTIANIISHHQATPLHAMRCRLSSQPSEDLRFAAKSLFPSMLQSKDRCRADAISKWMPIFLSPRLIRVLPPLEKAFVFASGHRSPTSRSAKIGGMKEEGWCQTFVSSRRKLL